MSDVRARGVEGVDIYYGHSAHVFQGVEVYRGKPILYDTGDFIDDYAVNPDETLTVRPKDSPV